MRVYEYAKQCGLKTKELLRILDENGIYNKSYQSNITEEEIKQAQIDMAKEDNPIPIEPVEINSRDYYDVKTELIDVYPEALYYICWSPRGVGKSTNGLLLSLRTYIDTNCPSVYIRRREVELDMGKIQEMFSEIISLNYIKYWTNGKYNSVHTTGVRSYLCKRDEDGKIIDKDKNFFLYSVALSQSANIKGIQLNREEEQVYVRYVLFDELFPMDNSYLPSEASLFFNTLSTCLRHYDKAKVILLGNCIVGSRNPILDEMGIDIFSFKLGEKRLYKYDNSDPENINYVACHFIDKRRYSGVSNKNTRYFNFGNQHLAQITGQGDDETYGVWELDRSFPPKPREFKKSDIIFSFFWIYGNEIYKADIVQLTDCRFIYCHKTGHKVGDGWLNEDKELIFSEIYDPRPNWINKIRASKLKRVVKIIEIMKQGKVYYQNAWLSTYFKALINNM